MKFDNFSELQNVISDTIIQPSMYIKQIFKKHLAFLVLIRCLYFLVPGHGLSPWPQFPTLAPNSYLPALMPNLYLPALASKLHLLVLAPNLYSPALAYNFITSPGPEFAYTNLVSSICICIYGLGLRFALTVRSLKCLYLIVSSSNSGSSNSNSNSSNFFGINNNNICCHFSDLRKTN